MRYRISLTINSLYYDHCLRFLLLSTKCQISSIWEILVCKWEEKAWLNMWEWSVVSGRWISSQYCCLRDWTNKSKSKMKNRNLPYVRICRIRNMRMIMSIMFLKDFKMDKTFLCSSSQRNSEDSHSKGEECDCSQWRSICEHSCDCPEDWSKIVEHKYFQQCFNTVKDNQDPICGRSWESRVRSCHMLEKWALKNWWGEVDLWCTEFT